MPTLVSGLGSSPMSIIPENPSGRMPRSTGPRYVTRRSRPFASGTDPRRSRRISTISVSQRARSAADPRDAQTLIGAP